MILDNFFPEQLSSTEKEYIISLGIKIEEGECFRIAQELCVRSSGKIKYYEGVVCDNKLGKYFIHAWGILNGKIIDLIAIKKGLELIDYLGYNIEFEDIRKKKDFFAVMPDEVERLLKKSE